MKFSIFQVKSLALSLSLWDDEMQRDLPKKWTKHGQSMIVFPQVVTRNIIVNIR